MDKVRLGIVGMGQRTCFHGAHIFSGDQDEIVLAAICDNRPDRLSFGKQVYEQAFGYSIDVYEDYHEMYEKAKLDGVFVAGPNYLHRDMTVAALEAGIHVLCEKPMEVTLAKCDEMIEAARRTGKLLCLGMQMQYRVRPHRIREIIQSGAIGEPVMVWCTEFRGPYAQIKDYVWDPAKSGGAIVEKNCHHYDILDLWVDSPPTTVYATGGIKKHVQPYGFKSDIVDHAWIVNDYESGAKGMVGVAFVREKGQDARELGVQGTEGRIYYARRDKQVVHLEHNDGHKEHFDYLGGGDVLRGGLTADFIRCIRTGDQPLVTPERGRKSLLVPMAAEKSIAEKRIVHVSELT